MPFNSADIIAIVILIVVVGSAIAFIVKSKKKGVKCIGCSCSGGCSGSCSACDTTQSSSNKDEMKE